MFAIPLPPLPIITKVATHAAAAALGAVAWAYRSEIGEFIAGDADEVLKSVAARKDKTDAKESPATELVLAELDKRDAAMLERLSSMHTASMAGLRADMQAQMNGLKAEAQVMGEVLQRLSARQEALEHMLEERARPKSGDGEVKTGRRSAARAA